MGAGVKGGGDKGGFGDGAGAGVRVDTGGLHFSWKDQGNGKGESGKEKR